MRFTLLIIILTLLATSSLYALESNEKFVNPVSKKITNKGSNRQALFISSDGILFISKNRKKHKDPQIYFKDLKSGREKRVTHQRGFIANGVYLKQKGQIIYTSSNDEDKESPFILKKYLTRFPSSVKNDDFFQLEFTPQEVYRSKIDGSDIERLTEHPGFDGFPSYLKSRDRLYFSRWKSGKLSLYAQSLSKKSVPWRVMKTSGHDIGLKLSPGQKQFIWNRFSPDFKTSQLLISNLQFKDPQFLTLNAGVSWSPTWHPNGESILYSAKVDGMKNFDLFEVSIDGKCQRQITSYEGDEFFPTISPDGKKVLFTSTKSGQEQIHEIAYPEKLNCSTAK